MPLTHACMIQNRMIGLDWIVRNPSGMIVGHYKNRRAAESNAPDGFPISYSPVG